MSRLSLRNSSSLSNRSRWLATTRGIAAGHCSLLTYLSNDGVVRNSVSDRSARHLPVQVGTTQRRPVCESRSALDRPLTVAHSSIASAAARAACSARSTACSDWSTTRHSAPAAAARSRKKHAPPRLTSTPNVPPTVVDPGVLLVERIHACFPSLAGATN